MAWWWEDAADTVKGCNVSFMAKDTYRGSLLYKARCNTASFQTEVPQSPSQELDHWHGSRYGVSKHPGLPEIVCVWVAFYSIICNFVFCNFYLAHFIFHVLWAVAGEDRMIALGEVQAGILIDYFQWYYFRENTKPGFSRICQRKANRWVQLMKPLCLNFKLWTMSVQRPRTMQLITTQHKAVTISKQWNYMKKPCGGRGHFRPGKWGGLWQTIL